MNNTTESDIKPPYVAYKTFANFIASLRESSLPSRIDRSVFPGLSGASQSYLISTFKFFGFIDENGNPTTELKELVANPKNEKAVLAKVVKKGYDFLFNGGLDLQSATEAQVEEKFKEKGLGGETVRKALSFFVMVSESAGIALGSYLKSKRSTANGGGTTRRYRKRKSPIEDETDPPPRGESLQDKLLAKFPEFNPAWDADMQKKWFATFEQFMKSASAADATD